MAAEGHRVVPEHLARDPLDELLDPRHRVAVVGVRLVPLEHRELGVVLERDALVAKVLAELVDALEPADDQALEVQLGRDPEVEVRVELVVSGSRTAGRTRRRSAAAGSASRPRRTPRSSSARRIAVTTRARSEERLARLLVHQQVEVALAVAELDVGQAVERVRQRLRVAREHLDARRRASDGSPRRDFAGRPTTPTTSPRWTSSSPVGRGVADHLDPPGAVDEVEEDELAHPAPRHRAAGDAAASSGVAARLERLGLGPDRRDLVPVGEALRGSHSARRSYAPSDTERARAEHRRGLTGIEAPRSRGAGGGLARPRPDRRSGPRAERVARRGPTTGARQAALISMILNLSCAARGRDLDGLALLAADDRLADGRLVRELLLGRVRLGRADDVVLDASPSRRRRAGGRPSRPRRRSCRRPSCRSRARERAAPRAARSCARASPARSSRRRTRRSRRCRRTRARCGCARRSRAAGRCAGLELLLQGLVALRGEDHVLHRRPPGRRHKRERGAHRADADAHGSRVPSVATRRNRVRRATHLPLPCDDRPARILVDRAGRDPDAARPRADGGRQRAGVSPPGPALRRRARLLRDGQLRRDRAPQRAHARATCASRADEHPLAIQLFGSEPAHDGRGGADGRGGGRRPRRPQLRLPREEGDEDRRRARRCSTTPTARAAIVDGDRRGGRRSRCSVKMRRGLRERLARLPRGRPAARRGRRRVADAASALGAADVHRHGRPRADGRARLARRRSRDRLRRHHLAREGAGGARDDRRRRRDGRPRRAGQPVGAARRSSTATAASRRARRSSPSSSSSSARPCASSASAARAGS